MDDIGVVGSISIKDNVSSVLKSIRKEQSTFRKEAEETRKELKRTWDKTYTAKVNISKAMNKVSALTGKMKQMGKRVTAPVIKVKDAATAKVKGIQKRIHGLTRKVTAPVIKVKDAISSKITKIAGKLKALGGKVFKPIVDLKDKVSGGLKSITGKLKSAAKSIVIPVAVAATVTTAALTGAVTSGMELENQKVSIEHFIGATNSGMSQEQVKAASDQYIEALRKNSNATPFETGEVIQAGSRAVSISGGDTGQAMELIELAEDMAAASGGTKTLSDAIEALADAKMGEMERLKEFGFKVSADEFDTKGFDGVASDLSSFFGGAAEKLSQTGAGLASTIKGKLKSSVADIGIGIVEKLKPSMEGIISLIDKGQPFFEKFGSAIADGVGKAIDVVSSILPEVISGMRGIAPILSTVASGFAPLIPQIVDFGSSIFSVMQQVLISCMPVISSIVSTVQSVLPAILPVIQTVVTTIGNVISAAAPIIAGLVEGIGTVVSTLAPIFSTIFGEIGEKVSSVLGFVGERMGWIQEVISTVAPLIGDIISTAWTVISPVMDIAMSVFETLFSVVQAVFPGIQKVIETVWGIIKPIVELLGKGISGIGKALGGLKDGIGWLFGKITGKGGKADKNAAGDNNYHGGITWVGEQGPELLELPRGSRILPNKESVALAGRGGGVVNNAMTNVVQNTVVSGNSQNLTPILTFMASMDSSLKQLLERIHGKADIMEVPGAGQSGTGRKGFVGSITVTIAKLAEQIIVREEGDIDEMADRVAKKIKEVVVNMG